MRCVLSRSTLVVAKTSGGFVAYLLRILVCVAIAICLIRTESATAQSTFRISESLASGSAASPLQSECLTSGASFEGLGEIVGERLMSVANPSQRTATSSALPEPAAACGAPAGGADAEGYLYAIDAVTVVRGAGSMASLDGCDSVASTQDSIAIAERNGVTGLQCPGCSGNTYTFTDSADVLRVLYTGMHHNAGSDIAQQDCNSDVRHALVANWENFFGSCTDESCSMMRHAFRPSDQSGSVQQFLDLLNLPTIDKKPFCNGSEFQDNDPIRRVCLGTGDANGEQVCQAADFSRRRAPGLTGYPNGPLSNPPDDDHADLGLVLPIVVPTVNPYLDNRFCSGAPFAAGAFAAVQMPFGTSSCPDGQGQTAGTCPWPAIHTSSGTYEFGCVARKETVHVAANLNIDGRVYNMLPRTFAGVFTTVPRPVTTGIANTIFFGAFYRLHQTVNSGEPGTTVPYCRQTNSTDQLGCLVQASPCSVAFGPRGIYRSNPQALPLALDGLLPTDANLRALRSSPPPANLYPLAHGAYFNTLTGFQNLTGNDDTLAECFSERDFADIVASYAGLTTISSNTSEPVPLVEFDTQQCTACSAVTHCVSNDGCCPAGCTVANDNNCAICGDGVVSNSEECDATPTYCAEPCMSCTSQCTYGYGSYCGDGIRQPAEQCDDGNDNDLDACKNDCTTCAPTATVDLTCNDVDDDCDGEIDEDYSQALSECGVGACKAIGAVACSAGQRTTVCEPGSPLAPDDATCDGVDDNCNGEVDEGCAACVAQTSTIAVHESAGRAYETDVCVARFQDDFNGSLSQWVVATNASIISDSETQTTGAIPLAQLTGTSELRAEVDTSHMVAPTLGYLRGSFNMSGDDVFTVRVSQNSGYTWTTLETRIGAFEWGHRARALPKAQRLLISFTTSQTEASDVAYLDRVIVGESLNEGITDHLDDYVKLWRRSSTSVSISTASPPMIGPAIRLTPSGSIWTSVDTTRMHLPVLTYWRTTGTGATVRARYSANGGSSWTTLENTSSAAGWTRRSYSLPSSDNLILQLENTASGQVYVDEVTVGSDNQPPYLFYDEFETTLSKWQQAGSGTASISTTAGFGGRGTARLPNNADLQATIDTSGLQGAALSFLASGSGSGTLRTRYSLDNGTTWTVADAYGVAVGTWSYRTIALPRAANLKISLIATQASGYAYADQLRVESTTSSLALSEGFEGTLTGWQTSGNMPPAISGQAQHTGANSVAFTGSGELRKTVDTSHHPNAALSYWRRTLGGHSQDTFVVRYSLNNGATWTNLDTSLPSTSWSSRNFTLPSAPSLLLSFVSNVTYAHYIDDVMIAGIGSCPEWYAVGSNEKLGDTPTQSIGLRESPTGTGVWAIRAASDLECDGIDEDCDGHVDETCAGVRDQGDGGVVVDVDDGFRVPSITHRWERIQDPLAASGYAMQALPDNGTAVEVGAIATSPRFDVVIDIRTVGAYEIWVRGRSPSGGTGDSVHLGLDGARVGNYVSSSSFHSGFAWVATSTAASVLSPGRHTLNAWMREDGFIIDQIVVVAYDGGYHTRPPIGPIFCNPGVGECHIAEDAAAAVVTQFVGTPAPPTGHVGGLTGDSEVTPDGAFTYTLPLDVPPGRQGVAPALSLNYNSRSTNGPLGVGWSIGGLSSITRCPRNFALDGYAAGVTFNTSDALCLDGERLVLESGQYGQGGSTYRTLRESYRVVTAYGTSAEITGFQVRTNDGLTRTYGGTDTNNARVRAPRFDASELDPIEQDGPWTVTAPVTAEWMLSEVSDLRGNSYRLFYDSSWKEKLASPNHGLEHTLREIRYTYFSPLGEISSSLTAERLIRFNWQERPDPDTTYVNGFARRNAKRLASIEMHAPMPVLGGGRKRQQVWRYELDYGASSVSTERSVLRTVRKCAGSVCGLSAAFDWSSPPPITDRSAFYLVDSHYSLAPYPGDERRNRHTIVGDFNGDNAIDIWSQPIDIDPDHLVMGSKTCGEPLCFQNVASPYTFTNPRVGDSYPPWIERLEPFDLQDDGIMEFYGHRQDALQWTPTAIVRMSHDLPLAGGAWSGFGDVNGDGYLDITFLSYTASQSNSYFRIFDQSSQQIGPTRYPINESGGELVTSLADITGDGKAEIIRWNYGLYHTLNASGVVETHSTNISPASDNPSLEPQPLVDFNGDGLADVLYRNADFDYRINTGSGFAPKHQVLVNPADLPELSPSTVNDPGLRVCDITGDGRVDLVAPFDPDEGPTDISVIYQQKGSLKQVTLLHDDMLLDEPHYSSDGKNTQHEFRCMDVNYDGLDDLVMSRNRSLQFFIRTGGKPDMLIGIKDGLRREQRVDYAPISDSSVYKAGTTCAGTQRCMRKGMDVVKAHRIDNGLGNGPHFNETRYFYEDGRTDVQGMGFVGFKRRFVTDMARSAGTGNEAFTLEEYNNYSRQTITYAGGKRHLVYPLAGVPSKVRQYTFDTDGVQYATITDDQYVNTSSSQNGSYNVELRDKYVREFRGTGAKCRIDPSDPNSRLEPCWLQAQWPTQRATHVTYVWSPMGQLESVQQQTLKGLTSEGFYDGQLNSVEVDYQAVGPYALERPAQKIEISSAPGSVDPNASTTRTTSYAHNNFGELVDEFVEKGDPAQLLTHYVRGDSTGIDDAGQLLATEWYAGDDADRHGIGGAASRTETYSYDSELVSLRSTTNSLGHATSQVVHPALGEVVSTTDANGIRRTQQFDAYGRVRRVSDPTALDVTVAYEWSATPLPAWEPSTAHATQDRFFKIVQTFEDGYTTSTQYDRLGRAIVTDTPGFDQLNRDVYSSVAYDALGRVVSETMAHYYAASNVPITWTQYDLRDRVIRIDRPNDASNAYEITTASYPTAFQQIVEDPMHGTVMVELDSDGRVARRTEKAIGSTYYVTQYRYAPFGLLEQVVDPANNLISIDYDSRGRLTHFSSPDMAATSYDYNAFNELSHQLDATGEEVEYRRDPLGRVTARLSRNLSGQQDSINYYWDRDGQKGRIGKLREAHHSDDDVWVRYGYDDKARPTHVQWEVQGRTMAVDTEYDSFGRIWRVQYPDAPARSRFTLTYVYRADNGFLEAASSESGSNGRVQWQALRRDPRGLLEDERFGGVGGFQTERRFYPGSGRLQRIETFTGAGSLLHSFQYAYDGNGRVRTRTGTLRNESYDYDYLGRLTHWTAGTISSTAEDLQYSYNSLGNLTQTQSLIPGGQTPTHSYLYGGAPNTGPRALRAAGPVSYQYDTRRRVNRIVRPNGDLRLEYSAGSDLPQRMISEGVTTDLDYDSFGQRVRKATGATETLYVPDLYERRKTATGTSHVFYVRVGDKPIAQLTYDEATHTDSVDYLHDDHLGSISHTTTGTSAGPYSYYNPWGLRVDGAWAAGAAGYHAPAAAPSSRVTRGFTAHEHDDSQGLINMRGRIYDPHGKHFLSPDPAVLATIAGASPGADVPFDLQSPGPWPHGKAASSGKEAFSAGSSAGQYLPPGFQVAPSKGGVNTGSSLGALYGAGLIGGIDARTSAGSLWNNASVVPGSQELNPYSYVLNNPVRYSDPTGFEPSGPEAMYGASLGNQKYREGGVQFHAEMENWKTHLKELAGLLAGGALGKLCSRFVAVLRGGAAASGASATRAGATAAENVAASVADSSAAATAETASRAGAHAVVPVLTRGTGREMLGQALNVLKDAPAAQRAGLARDLLGQISARATGGAWKATEMAGANGARAWVGEYHSLVVDAAGNVFKGANNGITVGVVEGAPGVTAWSGLTQLF